MEKGNLNKHALQGALTVLIVLGLGLIACTSEIVLAEATAIENFEQTAENYPAETASFAASNNPSKQDVLDWLTAQKNGCDVLSGQHIGHGYGTSDGYNELVLELERQSGRRVGLVEADYFDWDYAEDVVAFNQPLKEHWDAGGLVGLSWSAPNPWTGGDSWDQANADLNELLNPNTAAGQQWLRQLDFVASGLQDLEDAGVVVLFRPLHEMNGDWFWWGANIHPNDNGPYIRLWHHMYQYFTQTKGLDNLLWVYAASTYAGENWKQPVDYFYPGGGVVDIVGLDVYDDNLNADGYEQMLALGKPFALTEIGPLNQRDGSFDNLFMLEQIINRYPETIYWLNWHGWMENGEYQHLPIAHNQNGVPLMQHECVTTLDEIDLTANPPSGGNNGGGPRNDRVLIPYAVPAPIIDGEMDEIWNKVAPYPISHQLLGNQSSGDLAAQYRTVYDRTSVYLLVEVQDDVLQADSAADWWEDDGVEIYIDADLSGGGSYDGQNDYLMGFRLNDNQPKIGGTSAALPAGVELGQTQISGGYRMEIKLPLAFMGYDPANSGRFGFDIHINDDDDGAGRDGKLGWFATTDNSWERPDAFGPALLMDKVVYLPAVR